MYALDFHESRSNALVRGRYRDVLLNLRLCTEETARVCVDTHVFEIQLTLHSFAEIKVQCLPFVIT